MVLALMLLVVLLFIPMLSSTISTARASKENA